MNDDGALDEYFAVVARVDQAVATATATADDALRCSRGCVFLDRGGGCQIYEARPVLCRTHGLALRTRQAPRRGLRILEDVSFCELNYTRRSPTPAETLDADRIWALVVTVDRRFRQRVGLPDDDQRIELAALVTPQPKAT
jgi:hypothetical protein